jgi:hypothetical protein
MTPPPPERVIALHGFAPRAPSDEAPDDPVTPAAGDGGAPQAGSADGGAP